MKYFVDALYSDKMTFYKGWIVFFKGAIMTFQSQQKMGQMAP